MNNIVYPMKVHAVKLEYRRLKLEKMIKGYFKNIKGIRNVVITFDPDEKKVTRGDVVLDDYPSYEVIPLDTAFTYPSKFKFLDHIDEFLNSGLYMSYGMGYGTFNKKYVEEVKLSEQEKE